MRFLKGAKDAFSGDTRHWVRTHNPVLIELIKTIKTLPIETVDFFNRLLVVSHFTVERLVFPKEGKALLEVSLKSISQSQFLDLYTVLLAFSTARLAKASPEIATSIRADLLRVLGSGQTNLAEEVFDDIAKAPTNDSESMRLWKGVTDVFHADHIANDIKNVLTLYALLIESLRTAVGKQPAGEGQLLKQ